MSPEALEQLIREQLQVWMDARRARLFDPAAYAAADAAFIQAVMTAAGYDPPEPAGKTVRRAKRTAAANEAAAFDGAA